MTKVQANLPGQGSVTLAIESTVIQAIQEADTQDPSLPWVSPGFIDTQLNGYAGVNFSDPDLNSEAIGSLLPELWATGCTHFTPTLVTNTIEGLTHSFALLEKLRKDIPAFRSATPGYHLEGPYMSPGPSSGAHRAELMRTPDWDEFQGLQEAAGGNIRIVTIAPEWPTAEAFCRQAVEAGVRVSLSHTDGSPEDVHRLADAGASLSTHLGNGCPQFWDRHQSPFWAQLDNDQLSAGLICDRFHVSNELIRITYRMKGLEGLLLVTDAVYVAGLEPGPYSLLGKDIVLLETGQVVQADRSSMAGAAIDMASCVGNFMDITGLPLAEALIPATRTPARYLCSSGLCESISPGQTANLVLFHVVEKQLQITEVYTAGKRVWQMSQP